MARYNLNAIGLYQFIRSHTMDSLKKLGWKVEMDKPKRFIISKPLFSSGNIGNPAGDILLTEKHPNSWERFPSVNNGIVCGYNRFRHKYPFAQTDDGAVTVYLRGNTQAGRVMLAGSFSNWLDSNRALEANDQDGQRLDLPCFISARENIGIPHLSSMVAGRPIPTTTAEENDWRGRNTNSVFYVTNFNFVSARLFGRQGK